MTRYDSPARTGTALTAQTLLGLSDRPHITAAKGCGHDLLKSAKVLAATGLAYYAGCEDEILPLHAIGGTDCVTTGNVAPRAVRSVQDATTQEPPVKPPGAIWTWCPPFEAVTGSKAPGSVTVKACLNHLELPAGPVRGPLLTRAPSSPPG